jgi:hypothetical protein
LETHILATKRRDDGVGVYHVSRGGIAAERDRSTYRQTGIDRLEYELYGLTEEEIRIVERENT